MSAFEDALRTTIEIVKREGSYKGAARLLGISVSTVRSRCLSARARWPDCLPPATKSDPHWARQGALQSTTDPLTDETFDLRAAAVRGVIAAPTLPDGAHPPEGFVLKENSSSYDADGNLVQQWVRTRQGTTDGYAIPEGLAQTGESAFLDANGNVIGKWVLSRRGDAPILIDALRAAFAEFDGAAPPAPAPDETREDLLTVYLLPDLHFGMHSWAAETGANWDIKIATAVAKRAIRQLVDQSYPSRHAVLLGLGDYYHANDGRGVTPQSGNRLDVDGRFQKVYRAGAHLATSLLATIGERHEQVEAVFLPGNHDPDAAMTLSVALSLFYAKEPRFNVHESPGIAWYRLFGTTLLCATHGHTMKADRMAAMMAAERREDWGRARFCYGYRGHVHHAELVEVGGVRVETFASPAARDAFNSSSGYVATRGLTAITIHADRGEIGRHYANVTEDQG